MARIQYSGIVNSIDGSISGSTFQRNRSGNIVRKRSFSRFTGSSLQNLQKVALSNIAASWGALSIFYKNDWQYRAGLLSYQNRYGVSKILSGYQYYQLVNQNLSICNIAAITTPVAGATQPPQVTPTIVLDGSTLTLTIESESFDGSCHQLIALSAPQRKGASKSRPLCLLAMVEDVNSNYEEYDITSLYNSLFNVDIVDMLSNSNFNIACKARNVNKTTGLNSIEIYSFSDLNT